MFSWGSSEPRSAAPPNRGDDVSLTTILDTPALRKELVLLVAMSADTMRRNLLSNYDVTPKQPAAHSAIDDLISLDEPLVNTSERAEEMRRQREIEVSSSQMQGLKRAAVTHFDAWRVAVLRRLGEVLHVRPDSIRAARQRAIAQAEEMAQAKRDRQYWLWAHGEEVMEHIDDEEGIMQPWILAIGTTALMRLDESQRLLVVKCLVLLLLSLEQYTAHSRILLEYVTISLKLPEHVLAEHESAIARGLLDTAVSQMSADETAKKKAAEDASSRKWKVGLATVAGAALIGVTGGLAAPILAAGAGAIMHGIGLGALATLLGPLATNFFLVGGLFGAFGGKMTGKVMEKYAKEVADFKFIPIHAPTPVQTPDTDLPEAISVGDLQAAQQSHKLRVAIGISGILTDESDISSPWSVLDSKSTEPFALRYEPSALIRLGSSLNSFLASYAVNVAGFTIVRQTLLKSIAAGLWPITMMRAAMALDNPFAVAKARSDKAGKVLAQALMDKVQGGRPVTLIGFSLGARVIYSCLLELADQNAFGLIERVVLIGAPTPTDRNPWRRIRTVVAGRIVNAYSEEDWVLGVLYRATALQLGIAGLQPVTGVDGIENINIRELVKQHGGHIAYATIVGQILDKSGFPDLDTDELSRELQRARELEQARREKANRQGSKKRADMATMVRVEERDGQKVITMVDNTKPLVDIDDEALGPPPPYVASSSAAVNRTARPMGSLLDEDVRSLDNQLEKIRMYDAAPEPKSKIDMLELRRSIDKPSSSSSLTPQAGPAASSARASPLLPQEVAEHGEGHTSPVQGVQPPLAAAQNGSSTVTKSKEEEKEEEEAELEEDYDEGSDEDDGPLQMVDHEPIAELDSEPETEVGRTREVLGNTRRP